MDAIQGVGMEEEYEWIDDDKRKEELMFSDELHYWFVSNGKIHKGLVPMAYEDLDVEKARKINAELEKAIEFIDNGV